jgi:hypothetical protein
MIIFSNMQRLCHGGWILAALVLMVLNGFGFLSIEGQTVKGHSPLIKSLQQKLVRLENTSSVQKIINVSQKEIQRLFAVYHRAKPNSIEDKKMSEKIDRPLRNMGEPVLPPLNGIIKIVDNSGSTYYKALFGEKSYREKDRLMNFLITDISLRGVTLSHSNKRRFIQSPTIYYSIDQGE